MHEDIYYNEILDTWVDLHEDEASTNRRFEELSKVMDPMYDFVLAYSNYYNERHDYGDGQKLTMTEAHILTYIADHPLTTVTEISNVWHRTTSAISQTVRKLIKAEMVERKNSENDGKVFHLSATELGKRIALNHKRYDNIDIIKTKKKLLKHFTVKELVAFDRVCEVYTKLLRDHHDI